MRSTTRCRKRSMYWIMCERPNGCNIYYPISVENAYRRNLRRSMRTFKLMGNLDVWDSDRAMYNRSARGEKVRLGRFGVHVVRAREPRGLFGPKIIWFEYLRGACECHIVTIVNVEFTYLSEECR